MTGFSIEGGTQRLIAAYCGIYSRFVFKSLFVSLFCFSSLLELFQNYSSVSYTTVIQTKLGNFFNVLAPVVRKMDNAIQRINHYPLDSVVCFVNTCPLDSDLSGGQRYTAFEQLGPGLDR